VSSELAHFIESTYGSDASLPTPQPTGEPGTDGSGGGGLDAGGLGVGTDDDGVLLWSMVLLIIIGAVGGASRSHVARVGAHGRGDDAVLGGAMLAACVLRW